MSKSVSESIRRAAEVHGVALLPFVAAGFPSVDEMISTLRAIDQVEGIGGIEIGFPFSDPIADGPVIQEAFNVALRSGITTKKVLESISKLTLQTPLIAMVSYSIVFRYGVERFVADAKSSGFSAILIPDLPPPEAESVCKLICANQLDTVLLVAPTTSPKRRQTICKLASGFVYYLSVSGITGERDRLPGDLKQQVLDLKSISTVPICVGFGISKREHMRQLLGVADGAIVGTAIVRAMKSENPSASVADFCRQLLQD